MPRTTRARSRGDSVTSASGEVSETAHAAIRAKKAKKSSRKETVREDDRQDETVTAQAADQALVLHEESTPRVLNLAPGRVSELLGPNVQLKGHGGAIYSCAFDPSGALLASGSMDKNILLWDVFSKDGCTNYNVLTGHKGAILEVKWLPSSASSPALVSCSSDKTVSLWDADKGVRLRKMEEHGAIVNCCNIDALNPHCVVSGSDDCTAILWDTRSKETTSLFHDYQVTSAALAEDAKTVYTGGIDNIIRKWDLRKGELEQAAMTMAGHTDTVTGLSVSPDGNHLLSNSMDCSLRSWNIRPFVTGAEAAEQGAARCEKLMQGVHHGAEKNLLKCSWSPKMDLVTAGSADRMVHIWDVDTCSPAYLLPGHAGSVNEVVFHPFQPIVASCSSDRCLWLGELA
jgi:Prp8 binding protein